MKIILIVPHIGRKSSDKLLVLEETFFSKKGIKEIIRLKLWPNIIGLCFVTFGITVTCF